MPDKADGLTALLDADVVRYGLDKDGRCIQVSQSVSTILGDAPAECVGRHFSDLYAASNDATEIAARLSATLRGEQQAPIIRTVLHRSGEPLTFRIIDTPDVASDGTVLGVKGVALNISAQVTRETQLRESQRQLAELNQALERLVDERTSALQRANAELRESEARLRAFFDLGPVAYSVTRLVDGAFVDVNQAFIEMTGYSRHELIDVTAADIGMHVDNVRASHVELLRRTGILRDVSLDFLVKSGERRHSVRNVALVEIDGESHVLAQTLDVTDQRRVLAALHDSEARMRVLLNAASEGIYCVDADGYSTFCNEAALRLFGFDSPAELSREHMHAQVHHSYADGTPYPLAECSLARALATGSPAHSARETLWRRDGTSFLAECWATPLFDDGKPAGAVITVIDISARVESEAKERTNRRARYRSERTGTARQLLAGLAHEVNQPLAAMLNYADAIGSMVEPATNSDLQQTVTEIQRQARRAADIVQAFRDWLGNSNREPVAFSVAELIDDVEALMRVEASDNGVLIETDIAQGSPTTLGDPVQLRQVLTNLVTNALDACCAPDASAKRVLLSVRFDEKAVFFSVADGGPGIPSGMLPTLFAPFHSTKSTGMGVGLWVARSIVDSFGGSLWVEAPREGELGGATLRFTLPRKAPA